MEFLIVAVVLLLVVVGIANLGSKGGSRSSGSGPSSRTSVSKAQRILDENMPWLRERWEAANEQPEDEPGLVPRWFFDDATERQLQRIEDDGLKITGGTPSKGQASDIIGLFEPPDEQNLEVLKFFKIPRAGMNQSRARHEVARLLADSSNVEAWKNRPASQTQREMYRFMGWKVPKGLTQKEAQAREHELDDSEKLDEWHAFSSLWDELCDPEMREDYEIKKPSLALFREAWSTLRDQGASYDDLEGDPQLIVDELLKLKPDLEREY